ncbi:hypothetical protein [Aureimonas phyllosphaerae]|uniref:Uncharacterized protein n=1 Tax=Aureimonas phyllosphaerae TaxID=1166078 RepID=A0A7W6FUH5_9HYPH|nr:hypothetical protein [Aureimonas phyllosphaerae]MBB3936076.1 hypothetical protein [Aureimonas phyllosphaerae]MBB3960199.1 hypothetical protein [Aureimonas phyllosphaerae]SFF34221.1 hypothetical protein SAMN05216566_108183 [Aureimonas phyllosphaerae]
MNILRFPDTSRTGDRSGGPAEPSRAVPAAGESGQASSDARILRAMSVLNRPVLDAVMGRRPGAQRVLAAFRADWTPPALRAPRPANDAPAS